MKATVYQVRRQRGSLDAGWLKARFSFSFGGYVHPQGDRFGPVLALNEDEVQPGTGFPMHPHRNLEIFMIPLAGAIAHEDSLGNRLVVRTGEVLMMRAGSGIHHSQFNASETALDRHLQLWIEPDRSGLAPRVELQAVPAVACGHSHLLAAPQGEAGQFELAQRAQVLLGAACPGRPLVLQPAAGQAAYLHVVAGECTLRLPGGAVESLVAGEAVAIESLAQAATVEAGARRVDLLLVTFAPTGP